MAKKTITITEGRKELFKIAEEVQRPDTRYTLTIEGRPSVVLMSADEYDSMVETMEILSDPETMQNIKKAEEEYERGEYYTWEEVKKELGYREKDFVMAEKPKKRYQPKSKKK